MYHNNRQAANETDEQKVKDEEGGDHPRSPGLRY